MKQPWQFGSAIVIRLVAIVMIGGLTILGTAEVGASGDCEDEWVGCFDECIEDEECMTEEGCIGKFECISCADGRDGKICAVEDV